MAMYVWWWAENVPVPAGVEGSEWRVPHSNQLDLKITFRAT